jgi:SPP1 family predicted phage head-tail adaptor
MAAIGKMKQVVLEKYQSGKTGTGSTAAVLDAAYPIWASVSNRGGGRSYPAHQTQLQDTIQFRIYWKLVFDVNAVWKIVYDGRRHNITSIEKVNENKFNYLITAESKGER